MATFGTTVHVDGGTEGFYTAYVVGQLYTLAEAGNVTSMSMWTAHGGAGNHLRMGIWDSAGNIVAQTEEGIVPSDDYYWVTLDISPGVDLAAGDYYLGFQCDADGQQFYRLTTGINMKYEAHTYGALESVGSWASDYGTKTISIYATYTAGGGISVALTGVSG